MIAIARMLEEREKERERVTPAVELSTGTFQLVESSKTVEVTQRKLHTHTLTS